jgi:hypothetical protein
VTGTGEGECKSVSAHINVIVHPLPAKPVVTLADGILTSSSERGNEWYMAGGSRVDTTQTFKPTISGKYYVRVSDSNGCVAQSEFIDVIVEQNSVAHQAVPELEVLPNPMHDMVEVRITSGQILELEIVDVLGKRCFARSIMPGSGSSVRLSVKDWPSGTYYVIVSADGQRRTRRVVKR